MANTTEAATTQIALKIIKTTPAGSWIYIQANLPDIPAMTINANAIHNFLLFFTWSQQLGWPFVGIF